MRPKMKIRKPKKKRLKWTARQKGKKKKKRQNYKLPAEKQSDKREIKEKMKERERALGEEIIVIHPSFRDGTNRRQSHQMHMCPVIKVLIVKSLPCINSFAEIETYIRINGFGLSSLFSVMLGWFKNLWL